MKNKSGSILVLVAIFAVSAVILGVLVLKSGFFGSEQSQDQAVVQREATGSSEVVDRSGEIDDVSSDDEVSSIEKDLNETNLNSIDDEVMGAKSEAQQL